MSEIDPEADVATVDHRPAIASVLLAVGAGTVATAAALTGGPVAGAAAATGVVFVAAGGATGYRRALSVGTAILFVGVLLAGVSGASPAASLAGMGATVFAWDVADHGLDLGARMGRGADTLRNELVHAGGSLAVAAVGGGVGLGISLAVVGGQPVTAIAFLLVGVVLLAAALSD